ncbi:DUF4145 domain-containing protein [Dongia sp.]|uniref:DUF4145 domain-containing protein n=1 Tax=Dongia sp. TaxID=1977262 RepID=UPI0035B028A0
MDNRGKYVAPAIQATAFSCAHCGTLTSQTWFELHGATTANGTAPRLIDEDFVKQLKQSNNGNVPSIVELLATGRPTLFGEIDLVRCRSMGNLFVSRCMECKELSLWIFDRLIWPTQTAAPKANPDLPAHIIGDYEEAAAILDLSPRGAAALLRLCVQKLCADLGGKGKNLNDDIAKLVANGLDSQIQQALDILRVTGNNAVHPGQMDLKDDRASASKLFVLLNLIVDELISKPTRIKAMYAGLPARELDAIEQRNAKAIKGQKVEKSDEKS